SHLTSSGSLLASRQSTICWPTSTRRYAPPRRIRHKLATAHLWPLSLWGRGWGRGRHPISLNKGMLMTHGKTIEIPADRIPAVVLGATGLVGQRLVAMLDQHPWFRLAGVAAS